MMLKIFDKYLLKKTISTQFLLTFLLLCLVWLTQSLRFIELIISRNVSLTTYFSLVFYLIPDLLVLILPICLLISVIFTYGRLHQDHELLIFKSSGVNFLRLSRPTILLTILISILICFLNIYVLPEAAKQFREKEFQIRNEFSMAFIQPGRFNYMNGATIFVKSFDRINGFSGIFIDYAPQKSDKRSIIQAQSGQVFPSENGLLLILKNGFRQEIDTKENKVSDFTFSDLSYKIDLSQHTGERIIKPYERYLSDLLFPSEKDKSDTILYPKLIAEGHQRIIGIFLPFFYAGWALYFLLNKLTYRKRDFKTVGKILLCVVSTHAGILYFVNLNMRWTFSIFVAYAILITSSLIPYLGLYSPFSKLREASHV